MKLPRLANVYYRMEYANYSPCDELLKLADQLRRSATETDDQDYRTLFLRAAVALEARGINLRPGDPDMTSRSSMEYLGHQVNFTA